MDKFLIVVFFIFINNFNLLNYKTNTEYKISKSSENSSFKEIKKKSDNLTNKVLKKAKDKNYKGLTKKEYENFIKEIPIYHNAKIYDLTEKFGMRIRVHTTEDTNFQKVVNFYTEEMKKKGWNIVFPNDEELRIWNEALDSDRSKPPVITINLNKNKTKVNCNLMIGLTKDARLLNQVIIITRYLTDAVLQ